MLGSVASGSGRRRRTWLRCPLGQSIVSSAKGHKSVPTAFRGTCRGAAPSSSATSAGRRPDGPVHSFPLALRCASARRPAVDSPTDQEGRAGDALIAPSAGPGLPANTPSSGVPLTPPHHGATPESPDSCVRRSQAPRPCAVSAGWEGTLIATECLSIPEPSPRPRVASAAQW